jgi:hypothetical protein
VQTTNNQVATVFQDRREAIARECVEAVAATARGRLSTAELKREFEPMLDALVTRLRF